MMTIKYNIRIIVMVSLKLTIKNNDQQKYWKLSQQQKQERYFLDLDGYSNDYDNINNNNNSNNNNNNNDNFEKKDSNNNVIISSMLWTMTMIMDI